MNAELYDKLLGAACLMMYKRNTADEIAKCDSGIATNLEIIDHYQRDIDTNPDGYGFRKGWGIALIVIGAIMAIDTFMPAILNGIPMLLCISFVFFSLVIVGIFMTYSSRKMRLGHIKEAEEEYKDAQSRLLPKNKKLKAKKEELIANFEKVWKGCSEFYDFLPEKYQEFYAVLFMLDAVKSLRADTLKEAINLWEAELKWIAEQQQKRQFEAIRQRQNAQMLAAMSAIESNQEQLNSNLRDIKVMQFMDYYNKH